jgi:hypothetical protein
MTATTTVLSIFVDTTIPSRSQVGAAVPAVVVGLLVWQRRWRRIGLVVLGATAGAVVFALLDLYLDLPGRLEDAVSTTTWVTSARFPSLAYVAGAAGATMVGKPWLEVVAASERCRDCLPRRRHGDRCHRWGRPAPLAVSAGFAGGAVVLALLGAPNRRPAPAVIADAARRGHRRLAAHVAASRGRRAQL